MSELKKILVAEDDLTNAVLLKRILSRAGFSVVTANNGIEALNHFEKESFDALLTDWMMPQLDGIELIRRVRETVSPLPFIMMITALVSEGAKSYSLESGADDYIAKPIDVEDLIAKVKDGIERKNQLLPDKLSFSDTTEPDNLPPFVAVGIASSTGGPPTLVDIFRNIESMLPAAFLIVQHGPPWMLETFAQRLQSDTVLPVNLAYSGLQMEAGKIYIAPGDKHMRVEPNQYSIMLDDGPKENFVRPSADPLFRSMSDTFGKFCCGVVLTGLGRDGTQGASQIVAKNGLVIIQNPATAVAPSMPKSIIESGIAHVQALPADLHKIISERVLLLDGELQNSKQN